MKTKQEFIDFLDGIYLKSLNGDISQKERDLVKFYQEKIVTVADKFLANANLPKGYRFIWKKIRETAKLMVVEIDHGYDVLLHWIIQRELIKDFC